MLGKTNAAVNLREAPSQFYRKQYINNNGGARGPFSTESFFTAPFDGMLRMIGYGNTRGSNSVIIYKNGSVFWYAMSAFNDAWREGTFPVKKGDVFTISCDGLLGNTTAVVVAEVYKV